VKAVIQKFLLLSIRLKVLITLEEYLPTWENFVQHAFTLHRLHPSLRGLSSPYVRLEVANRCTANRMVGGG